MTAPLCLNGEIAFFALEFTASIVAVGGVTYLAGYGVESLGAKLVIEAVKESFQENLGKFFQQVGSYVSLAGKYTAYAVVVPAKLES